MQRGGADAHVDAAPVAGHLLGLQVPERAARDDALAHADVLGLEVLGHDRQRLPQDLLGTPAEEHFRRLVPQQHHPVVVERHDGQGGGADDRLQPVRHPAQRLRRLLPLRDVLHRGDPVPHRPIGAPHAHQVHLHVDRAAVLPQHARLVPRLPVAVGVDHGALHLGTVRRLVQLRDGGSAQGLDRAPEQVGERRVAGVEPVGGGDAHRDAVGAVLEGVGPLPQLPLGLMPRRHVADRDGGDLAAAGQLHDGAAVAEDPPPLHVPPPDPELHPLQPFPGQDSAHRPLLHRQDTSVQRAQLEDLGELGHPEQPRLRALEAVQLQRGPVPAQQPAGEVGHHHRLVQVLEDGLHPLLAPPHQRLGAAALGGVRDHAVPGGAAIGVPDGGGVDLDPVVAAIRPDQARLMMQRGQVARGGGDGGQDPRQVVGNGAGKEGRGVPAERVQRHAGDPFQRGAREGEVPGPLRRLPEGVHRARGHGGDQRQAGLFLPERLGGGPGLLDVGAGAEPLHDGAVRAAQGHRARVEPAVDAVRAAEPEVDAVVGAGGHGMLPHRQHPLAVVGMELVRPAGAELLRRGAAGVFHPAPAQEGAGARGVAGPDQLRQRIHHLVVAPLDVAGDVPIVDVGERPDPLHEHAGHVADRGAAQLVPPPHAVVPPVPELGLERGARRQARLPAGHHGFAIVGVDGLDPPGAQLVRGVSGVLEPPLAHEVFGAVGAEGPGDVRQPFRQLPEGGLAVLGRLPQLPLLGDVPDRADHALRHAGVVVLGPRHVLNPPHPAVLADDPVLEPELLPPRHRLGRVPRHRVGVVGVDQPLEALHRAVELLPGDPDDVVTLGRPEHVVGPDVPLPHPGAGGGQGQRQPLFLRRERGGGPDPLRDVGDGADHPGAGAVRAGEPAGQVLHPADAPAPHHPEFVPQLGAGLE